MTTGRINQVATVCAAAGAGGSLPQGEGHAPGRRDGAAPSSCYRLGRRSGRPAGRAATPRSDHAPRPSMCPHWAPHASVRRRHPGPLRRGGRGGSMRRAGGGYPPPVTSADGYRRGPHPESLAWSRWPAASRPQIPPGPAPRGHGSSSHRDALPEPAAKAWWRRIPAGVRVGPRGVRSVWELSSRVPRHTPRRAAHQVRDRSLAPPLTRRVGGRWSLKGTIAVGVSPRDVRGRRGRGRRLDRPGPPGSRTRTRAA